MRTLIKFVLVLAVVGFFLFQYKLFIIEDGFKLRSFSSEYTEVLSEASSKKYSSIDKVVYYYKNPMRFGDKEPFLGNEYIMGVNTSKYGYNWFSADIQQKEGFEQYINTVNAEAEAEGKAAAITFKEVKVWPWWVFLIALVVAMFVPLGGKKKRKG